jgi:O-antigen/teichoic acid export membrane protein
MGIIQKQSIRSTIAIMAGFALGAFNIIILTPKLLSPEAFGLTRVITEAATTLATLCTFGSLPIVYKFFPFYKSFLPPEKNDLPFVTMLICLCGFVAMCTVGYLAKDILVRKFSEKSPLFVQYSYLVYPMCFFLLAFMWLESFSWLLRKGVLSNTLRETVPRVFMTLLMVLFALHAFSIHSFYVLFSLSYLLPAIVLFMVIRRTGQFYFCTQPSKVTLRLKGKMANFGLFLFGAQFLNLLSKTFDTFVISAKSERGLADAALFTIATYVVTLMEIPQRSITAITIPVLSESWHKKDMANIRNIYRKSVNNLLLVGLVMLSLILLNARNLGVYLGTNYAGIEWVIFFMGIGKFIDLATGANAQVIATSSYWKVDFTTNVLYTLLALPLNYILISHYGVMGGAYATLISLTFYNLMRFGFLWYQFGLQPYTWKELLAVVITAAVAAICYCLPQQSNFIVDAVLRSLLFGVLFVPAVYFTHISGEVNGLIRKYLGMAGNFLKRGKG